MTQDQASPTSGDSTIESLFEVTMRGYNKRQVEDYVAWLQGEVLSAQEEAKTARTEAEERHRDLLRTHDELSSLRSEAQAARPAHEEISERLGQILRLADEEAEQRRARAAQEAESAVEAARDQSAKVLDAARSAAEGIISAARERAEKEATSAKAEAESLLASASTSSQQTLLDAEQRAAQVLADADRRSAAITTLQDDRLSGLRDVHTDTLRRLEAVRSVLEKVLTAEADAGPPDSGIAPSPLPAAGIAVRAEDVVLPVTATAGFGDEPGDPLLSQDYVEAVLSDDPLATGGAQGEDADESDAQLVYPDGDDAATTTTRYSGRRT